MKTTIATLAVIAASAAAQNYSEDVYGRRFNYNHNGSSGPKDQQSQYNW